MKVQSLNFISELEKELGDVFSAKEYTDLPVTLDLNKYKTLKESFEKLEVSEQAALALSLISQEDICIFLVSFLKKRSHPTFAPEQTVLRVDD